MAAALLDDELLSLGHDLVVVREDQHPNCTVQESVPQGVRNMSLRREA